MLNDLVKRCAPLPSDATLCILGAGFSGGHLAKLSKALGTRVICTRRRPESGSDDQAFDSANGILPGHEVLASVTHLISTIPPNKEGTDPVLTCLGEQLQKLPLQWVGYFSTTGVYGNSNGNWVDETHEPQPTQLRSQKRLECEQLWRDSGLPVQILRLPGIYGPGRSPLAAIHSGNLTPVDQPGQMFCRIHVDDLAGACWHLIHRAAAGQRPMVVNISDNRPASRLELQRFGAELLGCTLPAAIPFREAQASMSPMALSFWADNRKVSNALLRDELGYTFLHPDFSSGLKDCFDAEGFNGMNPEQEAEP